MVAVNYAMCQVERRSEDVLELLRVKLESTTLNSQYLSDFSSSLKGPEGQWWKEETRF